MHCQDYFLNQMEVVPLTPGNKERKQRKQHQQQRQRKRQVKHNNASGWSNSMALFSSFAESKQVPNEDAMLAFWEQRFRYNSKWVKRLPAFQIPSQRWSHVGEDAPAQKGMGFQISLPTRSIVARSYVSDIQNVVCIEICVRSAPFFEPWMVTCGLTKSCSE
jgi:hypothetical protein